MTLSHKNEKPKDDDIDLNTFLDNIRRKIHKGIDLSQVSILQEKILKDKIESNTLREKEATELFETLISKSTEIAILLRDIQDYISQTEPELTGVNVEKINPKLTKT